MPGKTRPYEQFGAYILFKKLESDALGDLWRAGRIDDRHLGPLVALRRLTGGNREALAQSATEARPVVSQLEGTSFVKDQVIDVSNGVPFIAHEYCGGRSLRHVIDRAQGGNGVTPNAVPIDQAVLIAEKVALSLATAADLKYGGDRLTHGALLPQFIWISDDGEVRVAGQQLGKGFVASLKESKVGAAIGRYFSPEYQQSGNATPATEVYAMGAILYLVVTGHEPPDATSVSAFAQTIRAAKTMAGHPIPEDIRVVIDKSLTIDPARRFPSIADTKQALSALAHGRKYSATTFNLAFYLNNLLKKEMEGEAIDREKESKLNIVPYIEQRAAIVTPPPFFPPEAKPVRSKSPVYAAAAVVAAVILAGGFFLMKGFTSKANAQTASPALKSALSPEKPKVIAQPVVAAMVPAAATATTAAVDPTAQKKAFEDAVNQKLQAEMAKLQAQFNKQQQQQQKPKSTPVQSAPPVVLTASAAPQRPTQTMDDSAPSAAALDQRRLASRQESLPAVQTAPPVTTTQAPQPIVPQPQPQIAVPPPPIQTSEVREGDVVDFNDLDVKPQALTKPRLNYPPLAMRQRAQASIILTVFVSESGDVLDVQVLRGDPRFGFNEEAMRAMRAMKFRPGTKDGKRVKTRIPQPIDFKLQ